MEITSAIEASGENLVGDVAFCYLPVVELKYNGTCIKISGQKSLASIARI